MSVPRCLSHADVSTRYCGSSFERQLSLDSVRVWVATVDDVVNGAGISTFSHEHLGRIVEGSVLLELQISPGTFGIRSNWVQFPHVTYLAVNDGPNCLAIAQLSDYAIDKSQSARSVASWAEIQVLISATG